ncbi:filamentous hemagglutinin N-terminal domain-containing protein [Ramlibacter rhizophilus]|uniref:Filamentous hemagglutinin N-terminal domain-containing protein n=1 Tax=Ramlibacter rhizophilus TaxID=1781167 RepID=A0A4Z0BZF1_9BURK|nr:filamentous hemagglutinin N-terminal domain-containing protein [Ramlibacter rhizophilus]TFZ03339.1 filamentous hemagglutinin N-terminal domain-containing protein [Ramlibacter rhizophilus]
MRKPGIIRRPRLSALAIAVQAAMGLPAWALPQGAQVVSGQVAISQGAPGTLQVTAGNGAIINWQSFSLGAGELARFVQPSAQSAVLNRVTGAQASELLGQLQANGRVFLINPNGIVVGSGARIDTNSFVASTLDIADADFLAGRMRFMATGSAGGIRNEGLITAGPGGKVALIAPDIVNSGIIQAPGGEILLAAGRSIEIASTDQAGVRFEVQAPTDSVLNLGKLLADNGAVRAFAATLRNAGEIRADRLVQGADGRIELVASGELQLMAGGVVSASGGTGGQVRVQSLGGTTRVGGTVAATGDAGTGGSVQVLGERVALDASALVDASGAAGGGQVLVGGDYQGANAQVQNASRVSVAAGARLRADATAQGDGGRVIVWADENTRFGGAISARGGALGGNGGFAEVSGKQNLSFTGSADLNAPRGALGTLLLDPMDIVVAIGSGILPTVTDEFADFADNVVTIDPTRLAALGANVTLQASRHVFIKDRIALTAAGAGITVLAGGAAADAGGIYLEEGITTAGGGVNLSAQGIHGTGDISTSGGNVSITATGTLAYAGAIRSGGGAVSLVSTGGSVNYADVDAGAGRIDASGRLGVSGGTYRSSGTVAMTAAEGGITPSAVTASVVDLQARDGVGASINASERVNASSAQSSVLLYALDASVLRLGTVSGSRVDLYAPDGVAQAAGGSVTTSSLSIDSANGSGSIGTAAAPLVLLSRMVGDAPSPVSLSMENLGASAHVRLGESSKLYSLKLDGTVAALGASTLSGGTNIAGWSFGSANGSLTVSGATMLNFGGNFELRVRDGGVNLPSLNLQEGGAIIQAAGPVTLGTVVTGRASTGSLDPTLSVSTGLCTLWYQACGTSNSIAFQSIDAGTAGHVSLATNDNGSITGGSILARSLSVDAGGLYATGYSYSVGNLYKATDNLIDIESVSTTGAATINNLGSGNIVLRSLSAGGQVQVRAGQSPYWVTASSQERTSNSISIANVDAAARTGGFSVTNNGTGGLSVTGGAWRSGSISLFANDGSIEALGRLESHTSATLSATQGAVSAGTVVARGAVSLNGTGGVIFDSLQSTQSNVILQSQQGSISARGDAGIEVRAWTDVTIDAAGAIGDSALANPLDIRSDLSRSVTLRAGSDIGAQARAVRVDTSGTIDVTSTAGEFHVAALDLVGSAGERTVSTIRLSASAAGVGAGDSASFTSAGLDITATSNGTSLELGAIATAQTLQGLRFDGREGALSFGNVALTGTGSRTLELAGEGGLVQAPGGNILAGNISLAGGAGVSVGNVASTATALQTGVGIVSSGTVATGDLSGRQVVVTGADLSLGTVSSTGTYRTYWGGSEGITLTATSGNLSTAGAVTSATSASLTATGAVSIAAGIGAVTGGNNSSYWEGTDTVAIGGASLAAGNVAAHAVDLDVQGLATVRDVASTGSLSFDGGDLSARQLSGGAIRFTGNDLLVERGISGGSIEFTGHAIVAATAQATGDLRITADGAFDAGAMAMTANRAFISAGGDLTIGSQAPLAANEVTLTTSAGSGGLIDAQLDRRDINTTRYATSRLTLNADSRFNVDAANTQLTDLDITARFAAATNGGDSRVRTFSQGLLDFSATTQEFTMSSVEVQRITASSLFGGLSLDPLRNWNITYRDVAAAAVPGDIYVNVDHDMAGSVAMSFASDTALTVGSSLGLLGQPGTQGYETGGTITLQDVRTYGGALTARSRAGDISLGSVDTRGSIAGGNVTLTSDQGNIVQQAFGSGITVGLTDGEVSTGVGGIVTLNAVAGSIHGTPGIAALIGGGAPLNVTNALTLNLNARNDIDVRADGASLAALDIRTSVGGTGSVSVWNGVSGSALGALSVVRDTGAGALRLSGVTTNTQAAALSLTATDGGIQVDSDLTGLSSLALAAGDGDLTIAASAGPRVVAASGSVALSASGNLSLSSGGVGDTLQLTSGGQLQLSAGGNLSILAGDASVLVSGGNVGGYFQSITAGGDLTVRGGTGTGASAHVLTGSGGSQQLTAGGAITIAGGSGLGSAALVESSFTDQSVQASSLRIEGGSGVNASASLRHVPGGGGTQTLTLSGDLVVQGGNAVNQGSGASAQLLGQTQNLANIGGGVLVAGGSAQDNTAAITALGSQSLGQYWGNETDYIRVQGGTGQGAFARIAATGSQTLHAGHDAANPAAVGDIEVLGGSGLNARAELTAGGSQTIGSTSTYCSWSSCYRPTRDIKVAAGMGEGAAAVISANGTQNVLASRTIKLIGGQGKNATAEVTTTGAQAIGSAGTNYADATDNVLLQGGTGDGASASLNAGASQTVHAGYAIALAGGTGTDADALIASAASGQSIGHLASGYSGSYGYAYDNTDLITVTGGSTGSAARITSGAGQSVQSSDQITLQGGTGAGSQAQIVASGNQTVTAWGDLRIAGGTDSGTGMDATGIVLLAAGDQSVDAGGSLFLSGGAGATDVGIRHLGTSGAQTVQATSGIALSAALASSGVVGIDSSAGAQTVSTGGVLSLDNQGAAAVRVLASGGQQTVEAQSMSIALAGTQANAFAGLRTAAGFDQEVTLAGDGLTAGTASLTVRNTSTGANAVAGIQSGGALSLRVTDDNYDTAGAVQVGHTADTGRSEISAATDLDLVAGSLTLQGGATATAVAALNAPGTMNVSSLYGGVQLLGGAAGAAGIDPLLLSVVSNGSVLLQGGGSAAATSTIQAGTFNLAATAGDLSLVNSIGGATINATTFSFTGPNALNLNGGTITVSNTGAISIDGVCVNCDTNLIGTFSIRSYVAPPPPPPGPGTAPGTGSGSGPAADYVTQVANNVAMLTDAWGNSFELVLLEDGTVNWRPTRRNQCL